MHTYEYTLPLTEQFAVTETGMHFRALHMEKNGIYSPLMNSSVKIYDILNYLHTNVLLC